MIWFLLGVITGIIIGVLIDRDTVYKTVQKFGKMKVKKSSNVYDMMDIDRKLDEIGYTKKESRQKKRKIKRKDRSKVDSNKQ